MACVCQWAGKKKALCWSGSLWESPRLFRRYCSFCYIFILVKNTYCIKRMFCFILLFTFGGRKSLPSLIAKLIAKRLPWF